MQQDVPDGYKLTEVGVIPEDWEIKLLGELVSSVEYGSSSKSNETGTMPVLRMGNLQSGQIDWKGLVYTSDVEEIAKYRLNKNDVLFNRTNTVDLVGKTSIYKGEQPAIFAGYLIRIHRIESLLDADFLNYVLNSYHAKKYSKYILSVAVSQANINGQKLKTYPIPTPPTKTEQTLIANALSDTDVLIFSLEKLIAKKRAIKTAAMQQLLTGKKRLPPFDKSHTGYKQTELGEIPEDWELTAVGEALSIRHGKDQKQIENEDGLFPILGTGGEMGRTDTALYDKPSVLIGRKGTINKPVHMDTPFWTVDTLFYSEVSEAFCSKFIYYKFCQIDWMSYNEASGVPSLNASTIEGIVQVFPRDKREQVAISGVLTDMDIDIDSLKRRLVKAKQVKQGMMQELLTGRTRIL